MKKYIFTILIFLPLLVFGVGLEVSYPRIGGITLRGVTHPAFYAQYIFNFALATIGIFAFFSLVLAGFQYLTSAGDPETRKKAKERIKSTFFAILILAFTYIILTLFRREWGQIATISPQPVGSPPVVTPWRRPSYDPLLHVHTTANNMNSVAEEIKQLATNFINSLKDCKCENTKTSCAFTNYPYCEFVKCLGDPCGNRQTIDEIQVKLRIKIEQLLFYYRVLEDAVREDHLTPDLWGPLEIRSRDIIEGRLNQLRRLVENLRDPVNQLRPLITEFTALSNQCEAQGKCQGDCVLQVQTNFSKCLPSPEHCTAIDPNQPLCPVNDAESRNTQLTNLINQIQDILGQIRSFIIVIP
jgi:hypothetical protein